MTGGPFRWTDGRVREALGPLLDSVEGAAEPGGGETAYRDVSTDTRALRGGELFVALVGERFDAHDFLEEALRSGAGGLVVSGGAPEDAGVPVYRVPDTLEALGLLARHARRHMTGTVVGITGSLGKTTVKEFLRAAVAEERSVHANPGNWNNRVGLPLSLLGAPQDAEVVLLEMGTNEPGEIAALTAIAEPELAVVTTVADSHLEKLGSRAGVLEEKLALVKGLRPGGVAVVGDEPPELADAARALGATVRVAGAGAGADADLAPLEIRLDQDGAYRFTWEGRRVHLRVPGRPAVSNALLALATARELGVAPEAAARGVGTVEAPEMRGEVRRLGSVTVLVDCYNANPQSVRAAVETLRAYPGGGRRVAVLGSMLELGERSEALHQQTLAEAAGAGIDLMVATGAFARVEVGEGSWEDVDLLRVEDPVGHWDEVSAALAPGDVILLKASRGERLERLLPRLEERFAGSAGKDGGEG